MEGNTDLGRPGYIGPCPPIGRKHYVYTIHALKAKRLGVPKEATAAIVPCHIWNKELGAATLKVTAGSRKADK